MALLCRPKLLIADEPTTALDVTLQAQVMELLGELRRRHGTAILMITHDLALAAGFAERVHVIYAGSVVESAPTRDLFARPAHPYTRALLRSAPSLAAPIDQPLPSIPGSPPDRTRPAPGCAFEPRCAYALPRCASEAPPLLARPIALDVSLSPARGPRVACFESSRVLAETAKTPERSGA
jgi:oligopeptide/dipeptide ABC transporter ATP-binding protein